MKKKLRIVCVWAAAADTDEESESHKDVHFEAGKTLVFADAL